MSWNTHELIVLGAGGAMPRLDLFSPEDLTHAASTYPSARGSIYAFDFSSDGEGVVVGSRNGDVDFLQLVDPVASQASEWSARALPHRVAGVTQLLCISNDVVCILNEGGAGWCCNPNDETLSMSFMETVNRKLVALCHTESGEILGFAEDGTVLVWRGFEWDSPECFHGNPPCWNNLHARPIHWSAAGAIIYLLPDRRLAVLDAASMEPDSHAPDIGAADCISVDDNVLLTVDARTRNARLWDTGFQPIRRVGGLPADLVQCILLDADRLNALAVDRAGNALLLDLSAKKARVASRLPGLDYRVCAVRPRNVRQAAQEQRIRSEATRIAHQALAAMGRGETTDHSLDALDAVGYGHVSCALRASAAEKEDNLAEAIRLTRRQIESLPPDSPSSASSQKRYRRLLSEAGILHLYEQFALSQVNEPDTNPVDSQDQDAPHFEVMAMTGTMETICECATAADIPMTGHWHIKSLSAINCGKIQVTPDRFSARYNDVGGLPMARPATMHCTNTSPASVRQAVFFPAEQGNSIHLLLGFESKNGFSVAEPIVVFSPAAASDGVRAAEHNARVLADFHHLMGSDATKARLAELVRTSTHVLRRIITETQSKSFRKVEIK